ncbi:MAG: sigma 54-interacting transcriptional regulator [Burkholderiales bacterium]|nr:sigma 54-interacting transcriptional regulator [Burkholderiales bacterium]
MNSAGPSALSLAELSRLCDDLQRQVSNHINTKQELIAARDALDGDLDRFRAIQRYNQEALSLTSVEAFIGHSVEAIVDAFELECAAVMCFGPDMSKVRIDGQFGLDGAPQDLPFDRAWLAGGGCQIFASDHAMLRAWSDLRLLEAIACPFHGADGRAIGWILGARRGATFDPISRDVVPSFTVMAQQVGSIWRSQQLTADLREALAEVERYKGRLEAENMYLREEIERSHHFAHIIGQSDALLNTLGLVDKVALTDANVLISGETGTGKELLARAIHDGSRRGERPLVKVNCAALPEHLIESELFGHKKGAFSGAVTDRVGRFELADGGTIFLDEVGELPLELQAKLLRVLQEGEFERLGESSPVRVDVRVIAATNRDLLREISSGAFREDLYYRLNVFPIHAPALRERGGDVLMLAMQFAQQMAQRLGREITGLSQDVTKWLLQYSWPGNVRELQNVIERAVILSQSSVLHWDTGPAQGARRSAAALEPGVGPARTLREAEADLIRAALLQCKGMIGGKNGAARVLDIPASTLRDRIRKYDLKL